MAKKSKRQSSRASSRSSSRATSSYTPAGGGGALSRDFEPDYTHVITDLKRIGVLAGSFLVILIILSFIL
jgi:hypothetical protein